MTAPLSEETHNVGDVRARFGTSRDPGSGYDAFFALVSSLSMGGFVLVLVLLQFVEKGIGEPQEQATYVLVWPGALLAATVVPGLLWFARRKWLPSARLFWPFMASAHTIFWILCIRRIRVIEAEKGAPRAHDLARIFRAIVIAHPILSLLLFGIFVIARLLLARLRAPSIPDVVSTVVRALSVALATLGLAWIVGQFSQTAYSRATLLSFLGIGAILTLATRGVPPFRSWRFILLAHLFVLGGLILLLWFPEIQEGTHDLTLGDFAFIWVNHYNFLLAPVEAILQGRSPLVDANSQYGIGIVYFIAATFRLELFDWSTYGLARLICVLEIVRYFVLYLAMRRLTRSFLAALLFLGAALAINVYAPKFVFFRLPNEGPLRFIAEYTLVAGLAFQPRGKAERPPLPMRIVILSLVAFDVLWSPDMGVAAVGAYLGARGLVALGSSSTRPALARIGAFARDVGYTIAAICIAAGILSLHVRATAGTWPSWSRYYEYVVFYRTWSGWSMPIESWATWLPVGLVYLGSVVTIVWRRDASVAAQTVLAMSLVGIADMNYYIGRSLIENLAAVAIPAVFVGVYWLVYVLRETEGIIRLAAGTGGYASAAFLLFTAIPGFVTKVPFSLLVYSAAVKVPQPVTHSADARDAAALMEKYAPTKRRVPIFLQNDTEVEALLMVRKTQMWPIAYHSQDALLPRALKAALDFDAPLAVGDVIFVGPGVVAPALEISEALSRKFELAEIEKTPSGIRALRIVRKR